MEYQMETNGITAERSDIRHVNVTDAAYLPQLLTPCLVPPQLLKSCYSICHIECLRPVHGALNVDEKKN